MSKSGKKNKTSAVTNSGGKWEQNLNIANFEDVCSFRKPLLVNFLEMLYIIKFTYINNFYIIPKFLLCLSW